MESGSSFWTIRLRAITEFFGNLRMKKITILLFFTLFLFTSSALAMGMIKSIATLGKSSKASSFLSRNIDQIKNTDELAKKLEELKFKKQLYI